MTRVCSATFLDCFVGRHSVFDLYVFDPANQDVKGDALNNDSLWTGHRILRSRNYHRFSGKLDTAVYTGESLGKDRLLAMLP